jgi:hypothetical protein
MNLFINLYLFVQPSFHRHLQQPLRQLLKNPLDSIGMTSGASVTFLHEQPVSLTRTSQNLSILEPFLPGLSGNYRQLSSFIPDNT